MSGFTVFLGTIALFAGLGGFLGVELPLSPILLIVIGAHILLKPFFERQPR